MKFIQGKPFIFEAEEEIELVSEGISRQFYGYDNNIMMVRVLFKKGAIGQMHEHEHVQASYIVSGVFKVTIGDETQILNAGDGFYVESEVEHECICIEDGMIIDVFNPAREDFLSIFPDNQE